MHAERSCQRTTPLCPSHTISVEFVLDEQCEVAWHLPAEGVEPLPIFQTSSFMVDKERQVIELLGTADGQSFSFDILHEEGGELLLGASSEGLMGGLFIRIRKVVIAAVPYHPSPLTPHSHSPLTSHTSHHTCHPSPHTSHLTPLTSHTSHHTRHPSPHTSHLTPLTSHTTSLLVFSLSPRLHTSVQTKGQVEAFTDNYSLLPALEEGFFADLVVHSSEGQPFALHRTVLACCLPGVSCSDWERLLSGLSAPVLQAAAQ